MSNLSKSDEYKRRMQAILALPHIKQDILPEIDKDDEDDPKDLTPLTDIELTMLSLQFDKKKLSKIDKVIAPINLNIILPHINRKLHNNNQKLDNIGKANNQKLDNIGKDIRVICNPLRKRNIAVIMDNCDFYSGGRYFAYQFIQALLEIDKFIVTVYTNVMPCFQEDFNLYSKVPFKTSRTSDIYKVVKNNVQKIDLIIGFPVHGNIVASEISKIYNIRCLCFVFDPLPLIIKQVPEDTEKETKYFKVMEKALMMAHVELAVFTKYTEEWTRKWLGKNKNIHIISPVVNSRVFDTVEEQEKRDEVCYISRIVNRKNIEHTFYAFSKLPNNWKLNLITSYIEYDLEYLKSIFKKYNISNDRINLYYADKQLNDEEKFKIIKGSKVMINSSLYEGYGIWFIEAIKAGVPIVCYKYPVFEEIIKLVNDGGEFPDINNYVYFAEFNNRDDLANKLLDACDKNLILNPINRWNFDDLVCNVNNIISKFL